MTRGQQRALETLAASFTLPDSLPDPSGAFGRDAPLGLEIGFGMGHALLEWAVASPDWNLLGVEIYRPGVGALLLGIERLGLRNVRVVEGDAALVLEERIPPASLDEVRIFFPDPWPKKRHEKRRLIQPLFIDLLASRMRGGARLKLATDWQPYAEWMLAVLERHDRFVNAAGGGFAARCPDRPVTRFEARGQRLGHDVWDLAFDKLA